MVDRILRLTNPMMRGDDVLQLQQILSKKNYPFGALDGIFGRMTETAVRNFQIDNRIDSDGRVGPQTWNHLKKLETFPKNKEIPKMDFSLGKRKPENSEVNKLGEWNMRKDGNDVILSIKGKMSTFGGCTDTGVKKDEPLALFGKKDGDKASLEASKSMNLRGLFTGPNGMVGAARRLNEKALYIACRWRYYDIRKITGVNPSEYLKSIKVRVTNTRNGRRIEAVPVDWGPGETTGRVADLSPGAAEALGLKTDQEVEHLKTEATPMSPFPGPAKRLITFQDASNGAISAMKPQLLMKRSLISEKTSSKLKNSIDDHSSSNENDEIEASPIGKTSMRKTTSSLLFVGKLLRRLPTYRPNISAFEQALNLNDPNDLEKAKVILKKRKEWRNMKEINVLARAFESIQLFHEIKNGLEPVLYFRLFKELIYEEFDIGKFIFHVNDPPDKLYIILVGEVCILTPKEALTNSTTYEKMGRKPSATDNLFAGFSVINTMQKFQSFGEIALRNNTPRTASAACKTPCELVSLDKKTFRSVLKAFFENQAAEKLEFMRKVPLFKGIPNHHLQGLLLHLHEKRLKKGDIIFPEGTKVDTLYIIKEGEVQALKKMDLKDLKDQLLESKCDSKEKLKEVLNLREMEKFKELNSSWARKFTLQNKKSQILFCMGRGESFGESGLITNRTESDFTLICKSLTVVIFTISHQKIIENLRMLDNLGYKNIDSTIAKIKEQRSFFSKAYLTEGLMMKNMTDREKEEEVFVIPDEDEKRMRNTPTIRNMKPENQAYEMRNKAKYHYTTRYLPSNLLLTREIKENEESEFEEFTLEKNLLKMFNPQWFNMRKVNSLSNDFIKGNKDFSQKSIRPFTEMVKGLENLTKKNMPDIILYKSLKVKDNKAQKIYQYCSEVLKLKSNKNNNRKKERMTSREEEKTAKKDKMCFKTENVYNFCNVEKFKAPFKININNN